MYNCVCVCVCTCMCVCARTHAYARARTHTHIDNHTHRQTTTQTHTHTHTQHTHTHTHATQTDRQKDNRTHTRCFQERQRSAGAKTDSFFPFFHFFRRYTECLLPRLVAEILRHELHEQQGRVEVGRQKHAQAPAGECFETAEAEECDEKEEEEEEEEEEEDGRAPPGVKRVIPLVIHHIWLGFITFVFFF